MSDVYVYVPMEKAVGEYAVNALLLVAAHCGKKGYSQIVLPSMRVDVARNRAVQMFLKESKADDDVLVMLDADHVHPADIVTRLVAHNVEVVGALAFTRGAPFMPCFFYHMDGHFHSVTDWTHVGLMPCDAVGTGAIAIRRSVFAKLNGAGYGPFYFQCIYPDRADQSTPSEDMYFASACFLSGIQHHVDTSLVTPHLMMSAIDESHFRAFQTDKTIGEGVQ